jgi:hypothetical protein
MGMGIGWQNPWVLYPLTSLDVMGSLMAHGLMAAQDILGVWLYDSHKIFITN